MLDESARAGSHMCNVPSSECLHVIQAEVTAGARSRVKSGADGTSVCFHRGLSLAIVRVCDVYIEVLIQLLTTTPFVC